MGGGDKAPQAYVPANQPAADAGFFNALGSANTQTQGVASYANPGYQGAYQGVVNNPFDTSMISGINDAANNAMTVAQGDIGQGAQMVNQANLGYGNAAAVDALAPQVAGDANNILAMGAPMGADASAVQGYANTVGGQAGQVAGLAPQFQQLAALSRAYAAPMTADANQLRQYAPYLAEYGLDPEKSNYNYGLQQAKDSQNVSNAESGVAGSPFAAGATGDAMQSYTRNYQAAMASKAMQALQALSSLYGQAGNLDQGALGALAQSGTLTGAGADALNTSAGMNATAGGLNTEAAGIDSNIAALSQMASGVDNTAAGLYGQATNIAGNAANIGAMGSTMAHTGVETEANAAQMPYAAVNQVYSDRLGALDSAVNGGLSIANSEQGNAAGYNSYLQTGQGATALNQNAAKINAQNSFLGQLGTLVGSLAGPALKLLPQGG